MRTNLVKMLDHIGANHYLRLSSSAELFGTRKDLVHYTSALRYPVFKNGENYSGSSVDLHLKLTQDLHLILTHTSLVFTHIITL